MKKITISFISLVATLLVFSACGNNNEIKIVVQNTIDIERKGELTSILLEGTEKKPVGTKGFILVDKDDNQLAYQVLRSQDSPYSATILFQADVAANDKTIYIWKPGKRSSASIAPKVYGNTFPDRYYDFAWENDRIAFRTYNQMLVPVDGQSNGFDVWAKSTEELVLDELYKSGDYHNDNGKGVDFYKVGRTLGAGAMAPVFEGKLMLGENYDDVEIIEVGPLRMIAKIRYNRPLMLGETVVLEERTITLEAGSQLNKVDVEFIGLPQGTPVAAGIVSRDASCSSMAKSENWAAYAEAADPKNGTLFIGVLSPTKFDKVECAENHVLAYTTVDENFRTTYYQGAGWTKYGFADFAAWQQYLTDFRTKLDNPLKTSVK